MSFFSACKIYECMDNFSHSYNSCQEALLITIYQWVKTLYENQIKLMPAMEVLRILSSIANMNRTVYIKDMRINQILRLGNISRRGVGGNFFECKRHLCNKIQVPKSTHLWYVPISFKQRKSCPTHIILAFHHGMNQ